MSELVVTILKDFSYMCTQEPFNYVSATVVICCVIILLRKIITV
jgi:hypothetical protein